MEEDEAAVLRSTGASPEPTPASRRIPGAAPPTSAPHTAAPAPSAPPPPRPVGRRPAGRPRAAEPTAAHAASRGGIIATLRAPACPAPVGSVAASVPASGVAPMAALLHGRRTALIPHLLYRRVFVVISAYELDYNTQGSTLGGPVDSPRLCYRANNSDATHKNGGGLIQRIGATEAISRSKRVRWAEEAEAEPDEVQEVVGSLQARQMPNGPQPSRLSRR